MKTSAGFTVVLLLLLAGCGATEAPPAPMEVETAPEPEPEDNRETVELTLRETRVEVNYGRPELQGRDMISQLPDGQVWRLGMNEATVLDTDGSLSFGDTPIEAGRYSLWARKVSATEWQLIFNSEADIWGTARKPENDLVEVPLEVSEAAEPVEKFTIQLRAGDEGTAEMIMSWGTLELKATFQEGPRDAS